MTTNNELAPLDLLNNLMDTEEDSLISALEIAEKTGKSLSTVQRWLKNLEIKPEEYRINAQGSKTPLYSWLSWSTATDLSGLSAEGRLKYMIGDVEINGTEEQISMVRGLIDGLREKLAVATEERRYMREELTARQAEDAHLNEMILAREEMIIDLKHRLGETPEQKKRLLQWEHIGRLARGQA